MSKRPAGIALIALFFILVGVFSLIWSLLVFGLGGLSSAFSGLLGADNINAVTSAGMWAGFLGIVAAVVQIVVGIGLLGMKQWAWYLAMIAVVLSVVQGITGMIGGTTFMLLCGLLWLTIPVVVLIYLARGSMRKRFGLTF